MKVTKPVREKAARREAAFAKKGNLEKPPWLLDRAASRRRSVAVLPAVAQKHGGINGELLTRRLCRAGPAKVDKRKYYLAAPHDLVPLNCQRHRMLWIEGLCDGNSPRESTEARFYSPGQRKMSCAEARSSPIKPSQLKTRVPAVGDNAGEDFLEVKDGK